MKSGSAVYEFFNESRRRRVYVFPLEKSDVHAGMRGYIISGSFARSFLWQLLTRICH